MVYLRVKESIRLGAELLLQAANEEKLAPWSAEQPERGKRRTPDVRCA